MQATPPTRTSHLVSVCLTSLLIACDQPADVDADADSASSEGTGTEGVSTSGEDGPAAETGEGEASETRETDEQRYTVHGRAELDLASAAKATPALSQDVNPMAGGECPFAPESPPCTDDACVENLDSKECAAVVEEYCEMGPDDPACEPPGGEGPCDTGPELPPCEVCLDSELPDEACQDAWTDFCEMEPDDGGGRGTGRTVGSSAVLAP